MWLRCCWSQYCGSTTRVTLPLKENWRPYLGGHGLSLQVCVMESNFLLTSQRNGLTAAWSWSRKHWIIDSRTPSIIKPIENDDQVGLEAYQRVTSVASYLPNRRRCRGWTQLVSTNKWPRVLFYRRHLLRLGLLTCYPAYLVSGLRNTGAGHNAPFLVVSSLLANDHGLTWLTSNSTPPYFQKAVPSTVTYLDIPCQPGRHWSVRILSKFCIELLWFWPLRHTSHYTVPKDLANI